MTEVDWEQRDKELLVFFKDKLTDAVLQQQALQFMPSKSEADWEELKKHRAMAIYWEKRLYSQEYKVHKGVTRKK